MVNIKRFLKIVGKIIIAILLLLLVLLLVFSIPKVQTWVAQKVMHDLNEQFDVNINVDAISISYNTNVVIEGVYIADHHKDTLISAKKIQTSLTDIPGIFSGNRLDFGDVTAEGLKFRLKRYFGEDTDNISVFSDKFDSGKPSENKFILIIDHIIATDSEFSYVDENNSTPEIIALKDLTIDASNLLVEGKDFSIALESLKAKEGRGLQIDNLSTDFSYTTRQMQLEELLLETPNSTLKSTINFSYDRVEDLSDFVNKVQLSAQFEEASVAGSDVALFYDELGKNERIDFQGELNGNLNDFTLNNLNLSGMNRSVIRGNVNLKNVIDNSQGNFMLSGNFSRLSTNYYDLVNLLPNILGNRLPKELIDVGSVNLNGYLQVTPTTVSTNSEISTQLGNAQLDIKLSDLNDPHFSTYKGNVIFKEFNLGRLVGNSALGNATLNLDVDGIGFTQNTLNTNLKGTIEELEFNNYTYRDIEVLGVLDNPYFNGKLVSNDPNFQFEFNGLADVSESTNVYDFEADVAYADLNALNFVQRDSVSIFKGSVAMNVEGNSVDDAVGEIILQNTSYENQDETFAFEELKLTSVFENDVRKITVNSPDIINGEVIGVFSFEEVPALFENAIGSLYTNYRPREIASGQYIDFNFDIYNKIVEVFFPDIELAPNTHIKGSIEARNSDFKLSFNSPKITAFENMLKEVSLQVDNTNPLFNTYLKADSISTNAYNVSDFSLINVTLNDTLFVRSEFNGGENNADEFNLSFFHTINKENKSVVGIRKSNIKFKENQWYLNEKNENDNTIVFDNSLKNITLDTLVMNHEDEIIRLNGKLRDSTYKNLKLDFKDVDLAKITPSIDNIDLQGKVNGKLNLLQEKGNYYPRSSLTINDFAINTVPYGDLKLSIQGNQSLTQYNIKALLADQSYDFLKADGTIDVSPERSDIDLNVALENLKLNAFSPLGEDVLADIRGLASGNAHISGNYKNPDISGKLNLKEAGLKIPYLNVDFDFQENSVVRLSKQQFIFDNIDVEDTKFGTQGTINGNISHTYFSDWELNLNLNAPERLVALDTEETEESLYYGTAFISGNAEITGPTDELAISVNAATEEGTVFKIPLSETESIGDNSYIYFLTPEDKKALSEGKEIQAKEVKGLELFFDLDVTNDAEVEIVVDKNSGSSLRGRGAGTLLMEINTNGKFNMWGDFVVYEGIYNFMYAGLVQKEFEVVSGGSINWDGSPTRADLNIRALYKTQANPAILLENPIINRNIPVEVYIDLTGELTETDLEFEIDYPNLSSVVKSELQYRISDRQNTELQALSLITQGSFYSQYATGQNAITGNLFERASGLFDDIFSDEDGKFKVGINYVQGDRTQDQETADRFGVTLSTQISNRILINGKVGVPVGGVTESVLAGNVEVEFLLNEEGTLRANIFNRENNIQYIGEDLGYTQGAGLSYAVDFDTFKELIRKILNKELSIDKVPKEIDNETEEESVAPDYINFPNK